MVPPPRSVSGEAGSEYGTMLKIRNVQMLPDGRSVVETWGIWRFRIIERGTLDGYVVARVERVDDWTEGEDSEEEQHSSAPVGVTLAARTRDAGTSSGSLATDPGPSTSASASASSLAMAPLVSRRSPTTPTNAELMATCNAFLEELRQGTPWVAQRLNTMYIPMPRDAETFSFWMGALLPIDEYEKAKLLPIRSARLRLRLVVHWIEQLQNQW
ncbi:uncharacterized protein FIBRA_03781 [Fibroporia radiculosa]|uniref:Lon N-terminal domain-containing protein n=1 Tax=Fibroporia radiculosa TaxID=599839 RepID=J4I9T4_9APHY|nr:uncharacterized protein FIBRA_03781 [Fibroporia radiculosa]CCM01716.1 predicted protein [Fibroporia radiculosa]